MATVMATATMTTGEDYDDNAQGRRQQRARMVTLMGEDDNDGKDDNSKDDGDNGKDNWQGW